MEQEATIEMSASLSAVRYHEAEQPQGSRRAWTAPEGYSLYDALYDASYVNYQSLVQSPIDVFFTHAGGGTTPNPLHARLRYSPSALDATVKWKLVLPNNVDKDAVAGGDYYAYGFVPRDAADEAELGKLDGESPDSYADGAVLTIRGLKTVGYDASVIIGAKEGNDADHDNGLQAGDFSFKLKKGESATNYLYFLFDHLCSALIIKMRVNGEYHALRHIKLKKLMLETRKDDDPVKKTANVTVELKANGTGTNPIQEVTYTPTGEDGSAEYVFSSTEGHWLTTEYGGTLLLTHFMPYEVTKLVVTSTYDVYDVNVTPEHPDGNLIRKDCTATNTIPLSLIDRFDRAERGKKYTLNMTIKPTYLYVLSEPDLDSPTIEVKSE